MQAQYQNRNRTPTGNKKRQGGNIALPFPHPSNVANVGEIWKAFII
jgi:hypothetical protein